MFPCACKAALLGWILRLWASVFLCFCNTAHRLAGCVLHDLHRVAPCCLQIADMRHGPHERKRLRSSRFPLPFFAAWSGGPTAPPLRTGWDLRTLVDFTAPVSLVHSVFSPSPLASCTLLDPVSPLQVQLRQHLLAPGSRSRPCPSSYTDHLAQNVSFRLPVHLRPFLLRLLFKHSRLQHSLPPWHTSNRSVLPASLALTLVQRLPAWPRPAHQHTLATASKTASLTIRMRYVSLCDTAYLLQDLDLIVLLLPALNFI